MKRIKNETYKLAIAQTVRADRPLVGTAAKTGELLGAATSCSMCRRTIINAGIRRVVIRNTPTEFTIVPVQQWIDDDESLFDLSEFDLCGCGGDDPV